MRHDVEDEKRALACCILRAEILSGGRSEDPDNEIYWYTREKCLEIGRISGIKTPEVLLELELQESRHLSIKTIERMSEMFWDETAHPILMMQEVHRY